MKISFESGSNQMTTNDLEFFLKEFEELTYWFEIVPNENKYDLTITSEKLSTDTNRSFLYKNLQLEETEAPSPTVKFWLFENGGKIGSLFFRYYHDEAYKTHQVCIETNRFHNIKGEVLIVFTRLRNFEVSN